MCRLRVRYATYLGEGLKEAFALTVCEELARPEKYALGQEEVSIHSFRLWFVKRPLTPTSRHFFEAKPINITSQVAIITYKAAYYAIPSAWVLEPIDYYLMTDQEEGVYRYYADSFSAFFSVVMVFTTLENSSLAAHMDRLKEGALIQNCKYYIPYGVLLNGLMSFCPLLLHKGKHSLKFSKIKVG